MIDIVSDYAMATSFKYLEREDLGRAWIDIINNATKGGYLARHFGWFLPLMKGLPFRITVLVGSRYGGYT